jgi:membrane protease YdiL (CAAX protease family)
MANDDGRQADSLELRLQGMTELNEMPETDVPLVERPSTKGRPILAWIVILALFGIIIVGRLTRQPQPAPGEGEDRLSLNVMRTIGQAFVGVSQAQHGGRDESQHGERDNDLAQFKSLVKPQTAGQWLRYAVVAGEIIGPAKATEELEAYDGEVDNGNIKATASSEQDREILGRLYADYSAAKWDAPNLKQQDREQLENDLDWFGELALTPRQSPDQKARAVIVGAAMQKVTSMAGLAILVCILGLAGLVALVVYIVLMLNGQMRHLETGSSHGGVYAETFALWLTGFFALSLLGHRVFGDDESLLASGLAFPLSLLALAWPCLRGIPWSQVRQDIGWTMGQSRVMEVAIGVGGYAMSLPLVVIGLLIMLLLMRVVHAGVGDDTSAGQYPTHPVVQPLIAPDWSQRLQIFLLASVFAPIVEETMFRGVLYRHLREGSRKIGFVASVLFSGLFVSFIFAVIHPQGLLAVPVLMGLALGFVLVREWRGSLIAPMVAHGVSNAVTLMFVILLFGD